MESDNVSNPPVRVRILSTRCDQGLMPVASTKRPVLNHEPDCGPRTAAVAYRNKRAKERGDEG